MFKMLNGSKLRKREAKDGKDRVRETYFFCVGNVDYSVYHKGIENFKVCCITG